MVFFIFEGASSLEKNAAIPEGAGTPEDAYQDDAERIALNRRNTNSPVADDGI